MNFEPRPTGCALDTAKDQISAPCPRPGHFLHGALMRRRVPLGAPGPTKEWQGVGHSSVNNKQPTGTRTRACARQHMPAKLA